MASRSLGTLTLDVVAKIGGFTGALDKAARHSKKTTADIAKQAKQIGVAFAGAATVAAAAFTAATLKVTNQLSDLHDAAAVARIGVETFQAWEYAAEQAGVSTGAFEGAMRKATTTIGKAVEGSDSARKIFERLGVAILDVDGNVRSTEAIVRDYADAVAGLSSEQQKASATAALFGREAGAKLSVLLDEGNSGLVAMEGSARALGLVLDEDLVNAAESFGDQLDTIRKIMSAGLAQLVGGLIPVLSGVAQKFIDARRGLGEFLDGLNEAQITAKLKDLRAEIEKAPEVDNNAWFFKNTLGAVLGQVRTKAMIAKEIEDLVLQLARITEIKDATSGTPAAPAGAILRPDGDVKSQAKASAAAIKEMESAVRAANDAVEQARQNQGAWLAELNQRAQGVADELMTEEESIQASYERRRQIILNSTQFAGDAQTELLRRLEADRDEELLALNGSFWEKYLAASEENLTTLDELSADLLSNVSQQFGDAFESMIFDAESLSDAVRGMAESILRSIVNAVGQMVAQWLALQAVQLLIGKSSEAAAIAGAATTGTAVATAYAPAAALASLASFGANAAPAIAGMAATAAAAQAMALVGMAHDGIDRVPQTGTWLLEKGERVMTGDTSAKLDATLRRLSGGGGGVNVTVNNAPPGTMATARRGPDGSQMVEVLVADVQRDGPLSRAIGGAYGLRRRGS